MLGWSEKEITELELFYHNVDIHIGELRAKLGRSVTSIHLKANRLGLVRDLPKVMKHQVIRDKISKKASERVGSRNSFYGKRHKPDTIEQMKEKLRQRFSGSGNPFYGKKHTSNAKLKMGGWRSIHYRGEDNPAWRGGYEPYYGPNWEEQRRKALDRDKHLCQKCGAKENGREHDVHHIIPFRIFGIKRYEEANQIDNLLTLCIGCHRKLGGELNA